MPEVDEYSTEVLVVFLQPVVKPFYLRFGEVPEDALFKLTGAFTRDDFHQRDSLIHSLPDNSLQLGVNVSRAIKDVVEVKYDFGHA